MTPFYGRYPDGKEIPPPTDTTALRDYFAAKAMAAMIGSEEALTDEVAAEAGVKRDQYRAAIHWNIVVSKRAYLLADAMLAAREVIP